MVQVSKTQYGWQTFMNILQAVDYDIKFLLQKTAGIKITEEHSYSRCAGRI